VVRGVWLLYFAFPVWMIATAAGMFHIVATHQFRVTAGFVAAGWTVSAVVPFSIWWSRRAESRSTFAEVRPDGFDSQGCLGLILDYGLATALASITLLTGAILAAWLTQRAASWHITPPLMHEVLARAYVIGCITVYSFVLSGAAVGLMSRAFDEDWNLPRTWHCVLLTGPFLLMALINGWAYPALWTSTATHVLTLFGGWRWTDAPPAGPIPTWRNIRNKREAARINKRGGILGPGSEPVTAARRGILRSVTRDGVGTGIAAGPATLVCSATTLILMTREAATSYPLADVTRIGIADPAVLQVRIGAEPELVIEWRDKAKVGVRQFAVRIAQARVPPRTGRLDGESEAA
jgi:hypothetical protein